MSAPQNIVIIGATGGIGSALVDHYAAQSPASLTAVARSTLPPRPKINAHQVDITDEAQLTELASTLRSRGIAPDLVLVATGVLSDETGLEPEKSYRQQDLEAFRKVFEINTFAPANVAKHLLPIMPRKGRAVFAALSARVGSISDNGLGGWHAYRASKAALNMLIRNYAIETARSNDQMICVGLHPGTVRTPLSRPFSKNVSANALFEPSQSAAYLAQVIDGLSPSDSGRVFDWAGKEIPA
ncbi:SDR family NAD(P)-dependent oxidoreductase [Phaeobacter gallaeciensis]|uniref:SDR family NAD(P)-dependent oxidoreductase n=1 Tax=Phaeobacter gallaeciensis TaxID=60890 RepID=UPI000BBC3DC1|nr:SDR family NAD(P)-dependent oxidoreductase [Phaeobacter gallaeciensis]ATF17374.1 saccharopine dehydrogenase-like protein [Phaeobacter gallaeciensis]ATF21483.1 saccharopine dehydrogenase-like protein [Phaeobacter gallaeciensis]